MRYVQENLWWFLCDENNLEKIRKIQIRKKIGQNQQIFGRITENEVIEKIVELTVYDLIKKQFKIPNIKRNRYV